MIGLPSPRPTVLAIGAHADDAEFGAGASLSRWVREGAHVVCVAFSACERSVPAELPRDVLRDEMRAACAALGVADARTLDMDVRTMPTHRQEVLDRMLELRRELRPSVVLCPCRSDIHQDHATIAAEAVRAFRGVTTWGFILPWNTPSVRVSAWRVVEAEDVDRKIRALACYQSQAAKGYATEQAIRAHVISGGLQAGCEFAEPFETIRSVE